MLKQLCYQKMERHALAMRFARFIARRREVVRVEIWVNKEKGTSTVIALG